MISVIIRAGGGKAETPVDGGVAWKEVTRLKLENNKIQSLETLIESAFAASELTLLLGSHANHPLAHPMIIIYLESFKCHSKS